METTKIITEIPDWEKYSFKCSDKKTKMVRFGELRDDQIFKYKGELCSNTPLIIENVMNSFECNSQSKHKGLNIMFNEMVEVSDSFTIDWKPSK